MAIITRIYPGQIFNRPGEKIVIEGREFTNISRVFLLDMNSKEIPAASFVVDKASQITMTTSYTPSGRYYVMVESNGELASIPQVASTVPDGDTSPNGSGGSTLVWRNGDHNKLTVDPYRGQEGYTYITPDGEFKR